MRCEAKPLRLESFFVLRCLAQLLSLALIVAGTASASAQEIVLTGPLKGAPTLGLLHEATPSVWEWAYWASQGTDSRTLKPIFGIGAEVTTGILTYSGFPSGPYGKRRDLAELRLGSWFAGNAELGGSVLEGGLKLHLGAIYHASFGTWDLRAGFGYGTLAAERVPLWSVTAAYGIRRASVTRYSKRGRSDPSPLPRAISLASTARLFVTYRRSLRGEPDSHVVIGVEMSPSFFLPPYTLFSLGGGPPW